MLAGRGIDVTYETIRCWVNKCGPQIPANLRRRRHEQLPRWHLDGMVQYQGRALMSLSRRG